GSWHRAHSSPASTSARMGLENHARGVDAWRPRAPLADVAVLEGSAGASPDTDASGRLRQPRDAMPEQRSKRGVCVLATEVALHLRCADAFRGGVAAAFVTEVRRVRRGRGHE